MQNISQDISNISFEFPSYPSLSPLIEKLTDTTSQAVKILQIDERHWQQLAGSACPGSMMQVVTEDSIGNEQQSWNLRRFLTATARECIVVLQKTETDWQQFCQVACPDSVK